MSLLKTINLHGQTMPDSIALCDGNGLSLTYSELAIAIETTSRKVKEHIDTCPAIAMAVENSPAWAVMDLAIMHTQMPLVPIPAFFSDMQTTHAIDDAGVTVFITDSPQQYSHLFADRTINSTTFTVAGKRLMLIKITNQIKALPTGTLKITYTSGTTGKPKGVCLSEASMLKVAASIAKQASLKEKNQHLCVLPLAVLLENVAGLYANLLAGGCSCLLSSRRTGLHGSQTDITQLLHAIEETKANSAILIPELLNAIVNAIEKSARYQHALSTLHFLAVGGASVSPELLSKAKKLGLPVYEGYGLSESASVVALNTPTANKIGSVGKPLPHIAIKIANDKEVLIKGASALGYIGLKQVQEEWLATGDIGYLDEAGYLFINGRKKNIFITSYGRNVSPEWVERDLTSTPAIAQACIFGEAKPWNTAVIVTKPDASNATIQDSISTINQLLPDYARVSKWLLADESFTVNNNQLTPNGRLKRDVIWQNYEKRINALYQN